MNKKRFFALLLAFTLAGILLASPALAVQQQQPTPTPYYIPSYLLFEEDIDLPLCWVGYISTGMRPCADTSAANQNIDTVWPTTVRIWEFSLQTDTWWALEVNRVIDDAYPGTLGVSLQQLGGDGKWYPVDVLTTGYTINKGVQQPATFDENWASKVEYNANWQPLPAGQYRFFTWGHVVTWEGAVYGYWPSKGTIKVYEFDFAPPPTEIPAPTITPFPTETPTPTSEITNPTQGIVNPTQAVTPTQAQPIILRASAQGYSQDTYTIRNTDNYEVIIIEGRVLDGQGSPVGGANVEAVSGANPSAITTNSDGSYQLVINVPGGLGTGVYQNANFSLQLLDDLSISRIEILQTVSGAELAYKKNTAVLVFPSFTSQTKPSEISKIDLYVNDKPVASRPFTVQSTYTLDDIHKIKNAAIFLIQSDYVRSAIFEVRAVIDPGNTLIEADEKNNEYTESKTVFDSRELYLMMVVLSPDILPAAAQDWSEKARNFLKNTFPVPAVGVLHHPVYTKGWLNRPMSWRDAQLVNTSFEVYNILNRTSQVDYAVGLFPHNAYGVDNRGLIFRNIYPHAPLVSITFPITLAHEIGHVYLGGHEEVDDNPNQGGVSLPVGYVYDFIKGRVDYVRPNSPWINFMGDPYSGYEQTVVTVRPWVSPTAYNTILQARQASWNTPKQPQVFSIGHNSMLQAVNWYASAPFAQILYLSGYFENGKLAVLPPQILDTGEVGSYPTGEYTANLEAADGSILASASFSMNYEKGENEADNPGMFSVEIPYPEGVARLAIVKDNTEQYALDKSANTPTLSVNQPGGGNQVDGETVIDWNASDGDGDTLTYNVYYSTDKGTSWQLLALDWPSPNLIIDGSLLPGSNEAIIRVSASDGLNTSSADSPPFIVPRHTPSVSILPPDPEAEPWLAGYPNLLAASADDVEDGWLPGENYQWTSNKDGSIGQGNTLYAALSAGTHIVTVTVIDSDGQQASASVTINVEGKSPLTGLWSPMFLLYLIGCLVGLLGLAVSGRGLWLAVTPAEGALAALQKEGNAWIHRYQAGQVAPNAIPQILERLQARDRQGILWLFDPFKGQWLRWDGQTWQLTLPPKLRGGSRLGCGLALIIAGLLVITAMAGTLWWFGK